MIAKLTEWYQGLSIRERILVTVAGGLLALVVLIYGIAMPLWTGLGDAEARQDEAVEREARVASKVALLKDGGAARAAGTGDGAPLSLAVGQSAAEQGFTLETNTARGDRATSIAIAAIRAPALLAWLARLEEGGVRVTDLTLRSGANATVAATATLERTP